MGNRARLRIWRSIFDVFWGGEVKGKGAREGAKARIAAKRWKGERGREAVGVVCEDSRTRVYAFGACARILGRVFTCSGRVRGFSDAI